jgi:anti-sigma B factor antagonist
MDITANDVDGILTLALKGRLDFASCSTLKKRILEYVKDGKNNIILNLAQVDFINSSGLGTLVSILKEVRLAKGRLIITNLAAYILEIFEITQLSHIFEIHASEAEALAAYRHSAAEVG